MWAQPINHILLLASCIIAIEILKGAKILSHILTLRNTAQKATRVLTSKNITDRWKEKVIPTYAFKMLRRSSAILAILLAIIATFYLFSLISKDFMSFLVSPFGIFESLILASAYAITRKRISK